MWVDGYWQGNLKDGYPETYYNERGVFTFPWQNNLQSNSDRTVNNKIEKAKDNTTDIHLK